MPAKRMTRGRPARSEPLECRRLLTTYYVSNAGSDGNPGTSAALPWQTAAKVDATTFQPGDTILFQRGGEWREQLSASSGGTAGSPITYGNYGDASAPLPLFSGSDVLDPTAFTLVTGTTYALIDATAVHWTFVDGAFTHEAADALTQSDSSTATDPATDLAYVEATADTFTYDATTTTLYLNIGGPLTGHTLEAATRDDEVYSNGHSYLAFNGLAATETADDNAGYGFRIEGGSNVSVVGCDDTLAGKHNFGVIETTAFLGQDLTSSQCAPDAGFGGASAIAFYVDATSSGVTNATAQFIGCTFTTPNGAYPIMISHGDGTNPIASLLLKNMVSTSGYGDGMYIYQTSAAEVTTVSGGDIVGGGVEIDTDNSVIDGLTLSGLNAALSLGGNDDVVQNCVFTGINPDEESGHPAGLIDNGTGNVVRLNTFDWAGNGGAAIDVTTATTSTLIQGNIFAVPIAIDLAFDGGSTDASSDYNLFLPSTQIQAGSTSVQYYSLATWQSFGFDGHSFAGDPEFADAPAGNFALTATSPAIDLAADAPTQTPVPVTTDFAGNPRPYGDGFDAGAFEYQSPKPAIVATWSVTGGDVPSVTAGSVTFATFTVTLSASVGEAETIQYATVDGSATATTDYTATSGTLTFAPGETTRAVPVEVTPDGSDGGDSFLLELSEPSLGTQITSASASATLSAGPTSTLTVPSNGTNVYTDGRARPVLVHLSGPGGVTIYRSSLGGNAVEIGVGGTTAASTLTIDTRGAGHTSVGEIYVYGPLRALVAPTVDLTGSLVFAGAVARVTLGNLTGPSDILLGGTTGHPSLSLGAVSDVSVASTAALGDVSATSWSASSYGTITAPAVAAIHISGAFAPGLSLTGTTLDVGSATLGNVTGGTWTVGGRVGTISARSTSGAWSAAFAGAVGSITTVGDLAGSLSAASVGSLRVGGDLTSAAVVLTAPAGKGYDLSALRVVGSVVGSTVRSAGSVNSVAVGAITGSTLFAGVAAAVTALPTSAADFASTARLNAFTVTGIRKVAEAVTASNVAAASVGHVRVTGVQTVNGGTAFGFAAESLAAYTDVEGGKRPFVWSARDGAAALTTTGDYKVALL